MPTCALHEVPNKETAAPARSKKDALLCGALLLLTLARLLLAWCTPVTADLSPSSAFDDSLFIKLGMSIASGKWLGLYDKLTLAKNPGYPLFLAFCSKLGVRYQLVFCLLLVFSSLAFAMALRPMVNSRLARSVVYVALLYIPLCFTTTWFTRIYRDGLVIPLTIAVFAGFIGMYLRRDEGVKRLLPWATIAALPYGCLQGVKENGVWILPFVGVCSIVILIGWIAKVRSRSLGMAALVAHVSLLAAPFICGFLFTYVLGAMNSSIYGVPTLSERFSGSFARVSSDMARIDADCDHTALWISKDSLEDALAVSPTLRRAEPEIRESWARWSELFDNEEVYGDMSYWTLRDGVYDSGAVESATDAEAYWSSVADEIEAAFRNGQIRVRDGLKVSAVAPAIQANDFGPWVGRTAWTCGRLAMLSQMNSRVIGRIDEQTSPGAYDPDEMARVCDFLGGNVLPDGAPGDGSAVHEAACRVDYLLGKGGVLILRLCLLGLVPLLVWLLASRRALPAKRAKVELALVVAGLLLTVFAFEAATCWYVQYQLGIFTVDSYLFEISKYSPEFYVCLILATITVISVSVSSLRKGNNGRREELRPRH